MTNFFYILFTVIYGVGSSIFSEPLIFDVNRPFYYYIGYKKETSFVSLFDGFRVNMREI